MVSGGDIVIASGVTIEGDVYAVGSVTLSPGDKVTGTIYEITTIPPTPPIDLQSTGSTAVVTAIDIYNITTTDGETTTTCTVYVAEDIDTGTFGTVEDCTTQ